MEAVAQLKDSINLYLMGAFVQHHALAAEFLMLQYHSSLLEERTYDCLCGSILCKHSSDILESTMTVLEKTGNTDTKMYELLQKAITCSCDVEHLLS